MAEIVNANQAAGYHSVKLPAGKITSGAYVAVLRAGKSVVGKSVIIKVNILLLALARCMPAEAEN